MAGSACAGFSLKRCAFVNVAPVYACGFVCCAMPAVKLQATVEQRLSQGAFLHFWHV
jgi:hypothetical protein